MATEIDIRIDGMGAVEQTMNPMRIRRIRWSAANEAARAGRTLWSREVRGVLAAPAKIVNQAFSVKRSRADDDFAAIVVERRPIPLKYFKPVQNKVGVSVLIRKDKGRRTIKSEFGPRIDKFHGRVVKRTPQSNKDSAKEFQELYGQTAASVAANSPSLLPRVSKQIGETLQSRYRSKLQFVLSDPSASAAIGT